mgnify:CR=1 FL=1
MNHASMQKGRESWKSYMKQISALKILEKND